MDEQIENTPKGVSEQKDLDNDTRVLTFVYEEEPNASGLNLIKLMKEKIKYNESDFSDQKIRYVEQKFIEKNGKGIFTATIIKKPFGFAFSPDHQKGNDIRYETQLQEGKDLYADANLRTVDENGAVIRFPGMPRLSDLLEISLQFYTDAGYPIDGIKGVWGNEPFIIGKIKKVKIPSTNFEKYKSELRSGKTPEEAAAATPTGIAAEKLGFNRPEINYDTDTGVNVTFRRPLAES